MTYLHNYDRNNRLNNKHRAGANRRMSAYWGSEVTKTRSRFPRNIYWALLDHTYNNLGWSNNITITLYLILILMLKTI